MYYISLGEVRLRNSAWLFLCTALLFLVRLPDITDFIKDITPGSWSCGSIATADFNDSSQ